MILITGASGALGKLVVRELADLADVVLGTRTPRSAAERRIDFDEPESLDLTGVATLLLISAGYGEDDVVLARHETVIAAAEKAGVQHVVYTSLSGDGDHLPFALAHRWTERRLARSPLTWTILRNGLYAEFLAAIATPTAEGTIVAPMGEGGMAAVARADLAEVAARVVAAPGAHAGKIYELVGERPLTGADLAKAVGGVYRPRSLAATRAELHSAGEALPFQVPMLVGTYSAVAGGFLDGTGIEQNALRTLLGRTPRSALDVYKSSVGATP